MSIAVDHQIMARLNMSAKIIRLA